ncbi:MAG TPA: SDR family oxidoreductase [Prosthecobacter sp.]|nr:SDR family oxidoreductase [Prosthecobacter sp.]
MPSSKIVLITGCSRGLGRAMVAQFIAHGWTVAGCARDGSAIDELSSKHPQHFFRTCDVSSDTAVACFCGELIGKLGPPHLVLNNAAVINANAPLWEVAAADFDRVIDVNIKGPANVMRHVLPAMMRRGSGVIVNFSSGWGRSTDADVAPYCATKWAIEGLSQAAAQDTGGKVAIIPLNPGIIDTAMLRSCFGSGAGDYPSPEEWARAAVPFLAGLGHKENGRPLTAPI